MNLETRCTNNGEEVDAAFVKLIRESASIPDLNTMFESPLQEAATSFVELAISSARLFEKQGEVYFINMIRILIELNQKEGFYERVSYEMYHTDPERIPYGARFLFAVIR